MLFALVESSLPEELLRVWQRSNSVHNVTTEDAEGATQSKDRLIRLIKFLEGEVQNELRISMAVKDFDLKTSSNTDADKIKSNATDHESANCEKAKGMSLTERRESVRKKHACFNCLKTGHGFKTCRVNLKCAWCKRRHVILMCPEMEKREMASKSIGTERSECSLANFCSDPQVFMQTLRVKLRNDHSEIVIRAIIDTGSQKSYITEEAAARMCYDSIAEQVMSHSLFGGWKSGAVKHKSYIVRLKSLDDSYSCKFVARDQKIICEDIPPVKNGMWSEEVERLNVEITDMDSVGSSISVMIGADIAGKLFTGRRHILKCGLVSLETWLGWTVMGKVPEMESREDATLITTSMFVSNDVTDLWALDVLEGRYEVQLPWLERHPPLNHNRDAAVRRLQLTVKRLKMDGLYEDYSSIFDEWLAEGINEYVPVKEVDSWGHYLPHRHVVKENSTTKIRPVFDVSAKEQGFPSLNECLEKGPNLIELIASVLLRFREGNIGVISDIRKAFLQISIDAKDRDFLRF
ncbi:hypothetical protein KPH14_011854 [Odynerus spinipes]|uniref:Peptidase aspartic putative domain-containing protein n=1 Tax=Odynerus spinipes TaxID=1348599 RepID=A0AAD9RFI6_9HYME|nr:hypothetical protein KPH14_011854 [Odynerus spinipes]